ncbi:sigma-70 family RNA polymerase sigma factor family protein [Subtercola endophyticus]|uniref:hypothetical protein n=1 Tax=Subtercola endophyticus TaxID=2895559 RepID=UPI001E54828A|nr:hypothetical protein [Subtercola endophyticus]UFS59437.1 hypothetical protein LQ955_01150 [Subtercola endophyticus]
MSYSDEWLGGRSAVDADEHRRGVHALCVAAESGQPGILNRVLDPSARMLTDAAGSVAIDRQTIVGACSVSATICEVLARHPMQISEHEVNGQTGLVLRRHGRVIGIASVDVQGGLVTDLWIVLNPDKLRHWNE